MSHRNHTMRKLFVSTLVLSVMLAAFGCQKPAPVVAPERQAIVIGIDDSEAIVPVSQLDAALHKKVQVIDRKSRRKSWLAIDEYKSNAASQRYVLAQPPASDG